MKRKKHHPIRYTMMDVMMASPDKPMDASKRRHQLTRMWDGLASIETAPAPSTEDWRVCSDAVNLMETMVNMQIVEDANGLINDAVTALAMAGKRHMKNGVIRLDAQGMQAVRAVLEDYASVIEQVSERTLIQVHRNTEKRIREILIGRKQPHDVEVMDI
jgi:uncharacterized protein YyaL (SSP411 family)